MDKDSYTSDYSVLAGGGGSQLAQLFGRYVPQQNQKEGT